MQNIQIAKIIKDLCKQKNIPITTLLQSCNLTKSLIYDLEKRNKTLSADKIERIADFFNVSLDYLVGRSNFSDIVMKDEEGNIVIINSVSHTDNPEINK